MEVQCQIVISYKGIKGIMAIGVDTVCEKHEGKVKGPDSHGIVCILLFQLALPMYSTVCLHTQY